DTQPPSAPGTLTALAASSSEIDLSWGAASDNVGVTGYRIERCQGAGCSTFRSEERRVGKETTYRDTRHSPSTSYTYRVLAHDAAGNRGGYATSVQATAPAA